MSKYLLAKHSTLVKMVDELKEENLSFDSYVKDLEDLIKLVFSKYSIEADLFEHETLEDYEKYMQTANGLIDEDKDLVEVNKLFGIHWEAE